MLSKIPADDVSASSIVGNANQEVIRSMLSPSVTNMVTDMQITYPLTASELTNVDQTMKKLVRMGPLSMKKSVESKMIPITGSLSDSMIIDSEYQRDISGKLPLEVETNMYPQISDTREEPNAMLNANTVNLPVI